MRLHLRHLSTQCLPEFCRVAELCSRRLLEDVDSSNHSGDLGGRTRFLDSTGAMRAGVFTAGELAALARTTLMVSHEWISDFAGARLWNEELRSAR